MARLIHWVSVLAALTAGVTLAPNPTLASDGPLRHAIRSAGCLAAAVKEVDRHSHVVVYEARCGGSASRVLTLSCSRDACRIEQPSDDE